MKVKSKTNSIAFIAKECGVSIMTVSRALQKNTPVKESTREKILQVAERVGYHGYVKQGRPRRIIEEIRPAVDVVIGTLGKTQQVFCSLLLTSIEQELSNRGYNCIIRTSTGEYAQFLSLCETLRSSSAAGMLIVGYIPVEQLKKLLNIVSDSILVDNTGDPNIDYPYESVSFDNVEAAQLAVRHLLQIGCRRIVLMRGFLSHYFSREIEQGYRAILMQSGIAIDEELIMETDFTADEAYDVTAKALDKGFTFDAVFTNDEQVCGVYRALHERKINIPSDVAVAGCDGLPVGSYMIPKLTTVMLDYKKLGQLSVEHLLDRREKILSPCRIKLIPTLEVRESTIER